ncbi:MAG TPA: DUF5131 family protein [Verrucomicrobiae bacterium]
MAKYTKIQWCHYTLNFRIGCAKKSICCARCYAALMDRRRFSKTLPGCSKEKPISHWGANAPRHVVSAQTTKEVYRWNAYAETHPWTCSGCSEEKDEMFGYTGDDALKFDYVCPKCHSSLDSSPRRVFVGSMFDWAEEVYTTEERDAWFEVMEKCTHLRFMLLTKRGKVMREYLTYRYEGGPVPGHLWIGWSWQPDFPAEIDDLLAVKAKVRFVSAEPLLGPLGEPMGEARKGLSAAQIEHEQMKWLEKIYQVELLILGGESGDENEDPRMCHEDWLRWAVAGAFAACVKVFVKQMGSYAVRDDSAVIPEASEDVVDPADIARWEFNRRNHRVRYKHPKGGDINEWPEELQVQEMPGF